MDRPRRSRKDRYQGQDRKTKADQAIDRRHRVHIGLSSDGEGENIDIGKM